MIRTEYTTKGPFIRGISGNKYVHDVCGILEEYISKGEMMHSKEEIANALDLLAFYTKEEAAYLKNKRNDLVLELRDHYFDFFEHSFADLMGFLDNLDSEVKDSYNKLRGSVEALREYRLEETENNVCTAFKKLDYALLVGEKNDWQAALLELYKAAPPQDSNF